MIAVAGAKQIVVVAEAAADFVDFVVAVVAVAAAVAGLVVAAVDSDVTEDYLSVVAAAPFVIAADSKP